MRGQETLQLRLLGELEVARDGEILALPQSKKTRALLAYLAAVGRPQRRERLCNLLWDIPDDPRGSLRWSLSKLRGSVDQPEHKRIVADRDSVRFDNSQTEIDLHQLRAAAAKGLDDLPASRLESLAEAFRGEFLEGLDLPNCPDFQAWCVAEREETRALNIEVLRRLLKAYSDDPSRALPHGRRLLQLDPYDEAARVRVIEHLARAGRREEAQQLYDAGAKLLKQIGGQHGVALDRAWRLLRSSPPDSAKPAPSEPSVEHKGATGDPTPAPAEPLARTEVRAADHLPLPDKPSIAILPFSIAGEALEESRHIGFGIAEDIATAIANARWPFVASPCSTHTYRDGAADTGQAARDLGVRYVASGTLSGDAKSLRLELTVTDLEAGREVMTETYETPASELPGILGKAAEAIAGAIRSEFDDAAVGRIWVRSFGSFDAWSLCKEARSLLLAQDPDGNDRAIALLDKAISLDPGLSQAYSFAVLARYSQFALDNIPPQADWTEAVIDLAEQAVERDRKDALAHSAVGLSRIVRREHQLAIPALETAVGLNPSLTEAHYALGTAYLCSGRAAESLAHVNQAIRLSPHDPDRGHFLLRLAEGYLFLHDYERSITLGKQALSAGPTQWTHYSLLASAYGHLGREDDAAALLTEIRTRWPEFSLSFVRDRHIFTDQIRLDFVGEPQMFTDQDVFAHYLDGLRKLGVAAQS